MRKLNLCILNWKAGKRSDRNYGRKRFSCWTFFVHPFLESELKVPVIVSVGPDRVQTIRRKSKTAAMVVWRLFLRILNPFSSFSETAFNSFVNESKLLCHVAKSNPNIRHLPRLVPKTPYIKDGSTQSSFHLSVQLNMKHCRIFLTIDFRRNCSFCFVWIFSVFRKAIHSIFLKRQHWVQSGKSCLYKTPDIHLNIFDILCSAQKIIIIIAK